MARKKRKRIASRGSVNTIILKTLINGDKYGYEIIKEVEKYSEGKIVLKQPSLYSSLSRFEEKGIVSSYWGDSDIGGRRHYYHLTDTGRKFYNENILKTKDEDIEEDDKTVTPIITPVSSDSIPAVFNFEVKEKPKVLPDHNFNTDQSAEENSSNDKELELIKALADKVKNTNKRYVNSSLKRLHFITPKKSQKVILDSDGIFKLRDYDYQNKPADKKENIIDNVIKRSTIHNNYGYTSYTDNKKSSHTEISEEEKRRRNELFLERFNNLTKDKIKPVVEKTVDKIETEEIDYRSKLNSIVENNAKYSTPTQPQINNLFNYDNIEEVHNVEEVHFEKTNNIIEDENDKFIDFEPTEFEVKSDNSHYAEEISNYSTDSAIKINRYEHKSKVVTEEKSYVLINKVRFIFAIILGLCLTVELTLSYFVFKHFNLILDGDKTLYTIMSILSFILVLSFMIPFFINSTQHSLNNFKLRHALTYGILLFLVSLILIYCINALAGFELDNFSYFATKLFLPALLTSNFIIMPPIYYGIINNKKFYD